ncbi:hypothetical protein LTSEBAI_1088 [Salmonella enterica subsp. enterica serovar Baildon str. R6-199]|nr:hypothetical protein LTSEBAI_1088 [Salmonella enterica subsp. enterica serovar Baildon str. R6-199]
MAKIQTPASATHLRMGVLVAKRRLPAKPAVWSPKRIDVLVLSFSL